MTWYEDLSPLSQTNPQHIAVGWLERDHPYHRDFVQDEVINALVSALADPWPVAVSAGSHACSLCRIPQMSRTLSYRGACISMGSFVVYIPGHQCIYVAPSLIIHCIDSHEYAPPLAFCQALLACPPMRSVPYFQALLQNGGRSLVRENRSHQ